MMKRASGLSTLMMLVVAVALFGGVLWLNSGDSAPVAPIIPTENMPTSEALNVSSLFDENFGDDSTPFPTVVIPQAQPTRPIIAQPAGATSTPVDASELGNDDSGFSQDIGATPTLPPPTADAPVQAGTTDPEDWNLPALVPPLSRDPQGRDHYWFHRPIEPNANNSVLLTYTYGAGGFFGSRIHHGIDMPNPEGEEVYAPAAGEVIFASTGRNDVEGIDVFQNIGVYGNVVFIRHDFGYEGQPVYTLYAHLLTALVTEGDRVEVGDPIGLVGSTGQVTGSHVHFEVRIGGDGQDIHPRYGDTYNPALWMVPYVGHGVVAGRVVNASGEFIDNATVTIRNSALGVVASVPTYTFQNTVNDVNPDPRWRENFAVGDIRVGTYDVLVRIDGELVIERVTVLEGMTTFVELRQPEFNPTPVTDEGTQTAENATTDG
ncbi:MAG: peptidoglycan DD-metalloendopeptidase family protein [Chloroflexota bacterium]